MLNKLRSKVSAVKNVGKNRINNNKKVQKIKDKCSELYAEYKEEEKKIRKELGLDDNEAFTMIILDIDEDGNRIDHHYRNVESVEDVKNLNMTEMFYIDNGDTKLPAIKRKVDV